MANSRFGSEHQGTPVIETPVRRDEHASTVVRGGPPRYFALTFGDAGELVAGTCERGIARSADGGHSWSPLPIELGGGAVNAIVQVDGRWWAAAGEAGVLRSDDGITWRAVGSLAGAIAYAVLVAGDVAVVGSDRGIFEGLDGSWRAVEGGPASAVYRIARTPDGALVAATEADGVWLDEGSGWRPAGADEWPVFALDVGGRALVVGTRGGGVLRSDDSGATWSTGNSGLPDPVVHTFAREPGGALLAGTGLGIARSVDDGRSWTPLDGVLAGHRIFSLAVGPGAQIVAGSYEGVWRNDGGDRWLAMDTGLGAAEAFAVGCGVDGRAWLGRRGGVAVSEDAGRTWRPARADPAGGTTLSVNADASWMETEVLVGTDHGVRGLQGDVWTTDGLDGMRVRSLVAVEPGILLAGTLGDGIQRRLRDGTWVPSNEGFPHRSAYDVLVSRRRGVVFVAGGDVVDGRKTGGVFRSVDGGRTWRATGHEPITTYRVVEARDGTLLAGAQRSCILRSEDGGVTWTATRPAGLIDSKLYWLSILSTDRIVLATGPQLLLSDDLGLSWTVGGAGLDGVTVYGIAEHRTGRLLVATSSGAYVSDDGGRSFAATE
jgi:hypothetical protein